ncbi:phosphoserine phosphatase SerB [Neptunicoccus cionae]|uniref:Phosphoserine phosphatase n=1 Tax=Neptunicoccus cionae TaxID=2035344 RepID=A0A916QY76_9RHOB|nr:phosphoserine phosphatase SerB [Amylibacter cionae]GGA17655.1 phosphoserine phosphatase SerB [Amylibacter cionae]
MYVATLISKPEDARVTPELVSSIKSRLNGSKADWLADGIACDVYFDAEISGFDVFWRGLERMRIDFCVQPVEGRRKKVLLADMDSTMIQQECIDELAAEAGVGDRVAEITARAMNGELDFEAALKERVGLLKGLPVGVIEKVLKDRITLMPGGPELVATMRANGAYAALVSGGFTSFTEAVADKLGFDENRANTLLQEDGKLTGEHGVPVLGKQAKVDALNEITAAKGLTPDDVIAVGDGANDLGMLHLAGSGVALHAKPVVAAEVNLRLNYADLTGLLYLQGYKSEEFVGV